MKTITKTTALISLLLLGCVGLMGQKNLLLQDIQPMMSYTAVSMSNIILTADKNSSSFNFYAEEKIQVKDWMLNNQDWLSNSSSKLAFATRLETEEKLKVEDWMITGFTGKDNWLSKLVKEDKEAPILLQDWMLCCKDWQAVRL